MEFKGAKTAKEPNFKEYGSTVCFLLFIPCAGEKCNKIGLYWDHQQCGSKAYIDLEGNILCYNKIDSDSCEEGQFIQNVMFCCNSGSHKINYVKFRMHERNFPRHQINKQHL